MMVRFTSAVRGSIRVTFGASLALLLLLQSTAAAQLQTGFINRTFRDADGEHRYVVFVPRNYSPQREWPVILFLHGAGERGTDGVQQTTVGLGPFVRQRADTFPFLVVFPQAEDVRGRALTGWAADSPDARRALNILADVERDFRVDSRRRVLTGWSMGGYGTWSIAAATPDRWSAIVPVAGGGDPAGAERLQNVPTWAFHGGQDRVIPVERSREMIAAIREVGGEPRFTELPDAGHDVWRTVYAEDALYSWMLKPTRTSPVTQAGAERNQPRTRTRTMLRPQAGAADEPFVPGVVIPNAAYVRLGNDMFKTLAYSIPAMVPQDALTGRINDIYDSTTAAGRSFGVVFSNIGYRGELSRASVQAYGRDRLNVQLGLQNVVLTIGSTYVSGQRHAAAAGPINIVIGHNRPVWLSFDVTPYIEGGRLRLRLLATRFEIPHDNWYVSSPAGVATQGLGMTQERVTEGLVSGLYGSKSRIEREVAAAVPSLLGQLEEGLDLKDVPNLIGGFWPLPVYQPRLQVWPQEVSTDANGVSLVLGVTSAAVTPEEGRRGPRTARPVGFSAEDVPHTTAFRLGIAPQILGPLTEQLVAADVARVHVLDIPEEAFAALADRAILTEAIPDLNRYSDDVEIWSELILQGPIAIVDASNAATSPDQEQLEERFEFQASRVVISLAVREAEQADWTPLADFEFDVSQQAEIDLLTPTFSQRHLQLNWAGEPRIAAAGRFAPNYRPEDSTLNVQPIEQRFVDAWRAWTRSGPASQTRIDDIDFGLSALRLNQVRWQDPNIAAVFSEPGLRISNQSSETITYQTRGPRSGWSEPYTLAPGGAHTFPIPYPMIFRRRIADQVEMFTLPAGSHSEFRVPRPGGAPRLFMNP